MYKTLLYLPIMFILLLSKGSTLAQDSTSQSSHNYGWVDVGLGGLSSSNFRGVGGMVDVSHLSDAGMFTLRLVGGQTDLLYPASFSGDNQPYMGEVAALYGRALRTDFLFASASVGLGVTWGNNNLPKPDDHFTNLGIPVELQGFLNIFPVIAIGGKIIMDVNYGSSFYSGLFCLRIGKIREIIPR